MAGLEWLIAVGMLMMIGGGVAAYGLRRERLRQIASWCEAARSAGLADVAPGGAPWSSEEISGWAGERRVRFFSYSRGRYAAQTEDEYTFGTRLVIEGDSGISLRPEGRIDDLDRIVGKREIEIGDDAFDRALYVQGPTELVRALLDAETRRVWLELIAGRVRYGEAFTANVYATVSLRDGDLHAEFQQDQAENMWAHLSGVLKALLAAMDKLSRPPSLVSRLVENTARETEWRVRLENILLLTRSHPNHPAVPQLLHRALEDERQEVQLQAAMALGGPEGRRVLIEIASREWADDACAARAIGALGEALPVERAREVLTHALRTRRVATAHACLEAMGRLRGPEVVSLLAKVLAVETPPLAVAAATALGSSEAPAAEAPLLEALRRERPEVRVAAAEALGRVGSSGAVLPLKDAAEEGGALRRAARQAVAEIQSRLTGASPGQLSLTESDGGRLSLADVDPKGQVSLAGPAPGKAPS